MALEMKLMVKKGFLDILLILGDRPRSFVEMKSLGVSPSTVLSRLREAQKALLVEERLVPQNGKKSRIEYALTQKGLKVLSTYLPVRQEYLARMKELGEIGREAQRMTQEIRFLLVSARSPEPARVHVNRGTRANKKSG